MNHQELVKVIQQELYNDDIVLALVLCGSVAKQEEMPNSDIDFLVINNKSFYQVRQTIRNGITVEFIEIPIEQLKKTGLVKESVTLHMLADGIILFDKISEIEELAVKAKNIVKEGPPTPPTHKDEQWVLRKRREITEIYHDLIDVDDEATFNYITAFLISTAIPLLFENKNWWVKNKKKTLNFIKTQCFDEYKNIEILLSSATSLADKRNAATHFVETVLKPHGGIIEGDIVVIKFDI